MSQTDFDDLLIILQTSKWNFFHFVVMSIVIGVIPPLILSGVYLTPKLEHMCQPLSTTEELIKVENCSYTIISQDESNNISMECTNWKYDTVQYQSSMTEEMNLVCKMAYIRPTFQTSYMLGFLIGAPINGYLSDKYGRRMIFIIGTVGMVFTHLASTFGSSLSLILGLRLFTGFFSTVLNAGYILCLEICEPKYRSAVGIMLSLPWAVGTICYGILAFLINDWRWFQRISIIPGILVLAFIRHCSESPRWLIINGDYIKALKILNHAAKWNGTQLPPEEEILNDMKRIKKSSMAGKENHTSQDDKGRLRYALDYITLLFRTREIRRIMLLMYVLFFAAATIFYGLSLNAGNFNLNPYMYMIFGGLMEIPAYSATVPIVAKFGRIAPTTISYMVCGIVILILAFISNASNWIIITLSMIGKLCIASAYQFIYLIATEAFPTECRTQALGTAQVVARLGSIAAPYITDSVVSTKPWVPSVIFGCISIVAGICSFFVPETLNAHLPETVEMLELEAKKKRNYKKQEINGM